MWTGITAIPFIAFWTGFAGSAGRSLRTRITLVPFQTLRSDRTPFARFTLFTPSALRTLGSRITLGTGQTRGAGITLFSTRADVARITFGTAGPGFTLVAFITLGTGGTGGTLRPGRTRQTGGTAFPFGTLIPHGTLGTLRTLRSGRSFRSAGTLWTFRSAGTHGTDFTAGTLSPSFSTCAYQTLRALRTNFAAGTLRTRGTLWACSTRGSGRALGTGFAFAAERRVFEILFRVAESHGQRQRCGIITLNGSIDGQLLAEHQHHATGFIEDHLMRLRSPEDPSAGTFTDQDRDRFRTLAAATAAVGLRVNHDPHAGGLDAEGLFRNLRGIKAFAFFARAAFIPVKDQGNIRSIVPGGHHGSRAFPATIRVADAVDVAEVELGIHIEMFAIPQGSPFNQPVAVLMEPF